jgi:hypothetical protein
MSTLSCFYAETLQGAARSSGIQEWRFDCTDMMWGIRNAAGVSINMGSQRRSDARRAFHNRERAAVTFLVPVALQRPYGFLVMSLPTALLGLGSITTIPPDIFQRSIFPWSASSRTTVSRGRFQERITSGPLCIIRQW